MKSHERPRSKSASTSETVPRVPLKVGLPRQILASATINRPSCLRVVFTPEVWHGPLAGVEGRRRSIKPKKLHFSGNNKFIDLIEAIENATMPRTLETFRLQAELNPWRSCLQKDLRPDQTLVPFGDFQQIRILKSPCLFGSLQNYKIKGCV